MVKSISAVDSLRKPIKNLVEKNKDVIQTIGIGAAGIGLSYAARKVTEKMIDLSTVPEGVDPSNRYLTDSDGEVLISGITNLPYINPWYNPGAKSNLVSAVTSLQQPPSMSDFLAKVSSNSNIVDKGAESLVEAALVSDIPDVEIVPDSVLDNIADGTSDVFGSFIDMIS